MHLYQIIIEYDGTNYVGWQKQKNGKSIQETIEKVLKKIFKQKINLQGSGRTDAGVHALRQSAHFEILNSIKDKLKILKTLNFFLNKKKITIINLVKKTKNFHSRFNAKKRIYEYVILNRQSFSPLNINRVWHIRNKLNIKLMKQAAKILIKTKDFSMFRSSSCSARSPIRTLEVVKIKRAGEKIIFTFKSQSFLQQQVRSMVGCLKYVGEEKWSLKKILISKIG